MSIACDSKAVVALTYWKYSSLLQHNRDFMYKPEVTLAMIAECRPETLVGQMAKRRLEQPMIQEAQILPMKRRA